MSEPTALNVCPTCGTQRITGQRYCANCGLDYWKQAQVPEQASQPSIQPPGPPPAMQGWAQPGSGQPAAVTSGRPGRGDTVEGIAIVRAALVAAAAISAVCWTWIMLEYEVHPWLLVLTAGAATGVAAGILQHRGLAIVYVVATGVALLDIFVYSTSDGTLRFTVLVGSTLVGFAVGIAAIRVFGRAKT